MLSATYVCVIARYATGDVAWDGRARLFELVGVFALPVTIVAAFIDTRGFDFLVHPRADAPLIWHMTAGLTATAAFGAHYLWRRRRDPEELAGRLALTDIALATFGMIALVAAGLLAGEMVYGT
jgi:uncharacterized membrane protein